jgi:copper chaperone CopZ
MSNYVHSIPGRLRIKTSVIKKNPVLAERIGRLLTSITGVEEVDVNLLTGSVLIRYKPRRIAAEHILSTLSEFGHFELSRTVNNKELQSALVKGGRDVGSLLFSLLVKRHIESPAVSLIAALI